MKYTIDSSVLFVNVTVPFTTSVIAGQAKVQLTLWYKDKEVEYEFEIVDYEDLKYHNKSITRKQYDTIKTVNDEIGINFDNLIDVEINKILSEKEITEFVKKYGVDKCLSKFEK